MQYIYGNFRRYVYTIIRWKKSCNLRAQWHSKNNIPQMISDLAYVAVAADTYNIILFSSFHFHVLDNLKLKLFF